MKRKIVKTFNLEAAKNGANVETRNGDKVEIIRTDLKNSFPILGILTRGNDYQVPLSWEINGTSPTSPTDSDYDLVIVEYEDEESEDEKMLKIIEEFLKYFDTKKEYNEIYDWIEKKKKEDSLRIVEYENEDDK